MMDQLVANFGAACIELMKGLQDALHKVKDEHRASTDRFQNQFHEASMRIDEQGAYIKTLEAHLKRHDADVVSLQSSGE